MGADEITTTDDHNDTTQLYDYLRECVDTFIDGGIEAARDRSRSLARPAYSISAFVMTAELKSAEIYV